MRASVFFGGGWIGAWMGWRALAWESVRGGVWSESQWLPTRGVAGPLWSGGAGDLARQRVCGEAQHGLGARTYEIKGQV